MGKEGFERQIPRKEVWGTDDTSHYPEEAFVSDPNEVTRHLATPAANVPRVGDLQLQDEGPAFRPRTKSERSADSDPVAPTASQEETIARIYGGEPGRVVKRPETPRTEASSKPTDVSDPEVQQQSRAHAQELFRGPKIELEKFPNTEGLEIVDEPRRAINSLGVTDADRAKIMGKPVQQKEKQPWYKFW